MGAGRAGMGGGSINVICPVHLLDGCGLVLGRGGAEEIYFHSAFTIQCV